MTKAAITVSKAKYDRAANAAAAGLALLDAMEKAGALRLPFIGYPATVKLMRDAVKK